MQVYAKDENKFDKEEFESHKIPRELFHELGIAEGRYLKSVRKIAARQNFIDERARALLHKSKNLSPCKVEPTTKEQSRDLRDRLIDIDYQLSPAELKRIRL